MISIEHLRIKKDIPEIPLITRKFDQIKITNEKIVLDLLFKTKEGKTEEITKTTEFLSKNFNISYERANFIKNSLKVGFLGASIGVGGGNSLRALMAMNGGIVANEARKIFYKKPSERNIGDIHFEEIIKSSVIEDILIIRSKDYYITFRSKESTDLDKLKEINEYIKNNKEIKEFNKKELVQISNVIILKKKKNFFDQDESKDFKKTNQANLDDNLRELNSLIGLNSIKNEVNKLVSLTQIQNERISYGMKSEAINRHIVFLGPPGTGKTTVARLIGKIYKSLGVLSKGHFVETDRSELVGEYIGQTAQKTTAVLKNALGGVLFIDEAYSLNPNSFNDYGKEAIETILKFMEDHRDDIAVIVAGYDAEMQVFLKSNPGLKSRFNTNLFFPNYSEEELIEIVFDFTKKLNYEIMPDSIPYIRDILRKIIDLSPETFGNGRTVRNLIEFAIKKQALRLASHQTSDIDEDLREKELAQLKKEDFQLNESELRSI